MVSLHLASDQEYGFNMDEYGFQECSSGTSVISV